MPTRSRTLGLIRAVTLDAWTPVFIVPAGRVAIVRRYSILNRTTSPRALRLGVRRGGQVTEIDRNEATPSFGRLVSDDSNLILDQGDELVVWLSGPTADNAIHCHASGSLLIGPPA